MVKRTNNDLQTIHRKLKIEQHEHPTKKTGVNSGALDGYGVPAPLMASHKYNFPCTCTLSKYVTELVVWKKRAYVVSAIFMLIFY